MTGRAQVNYFVSWVRTDDDGGVRYGWNTLPASHPLQGGADLRVLIGTLEDLHGGRITPIGWRLFDVKVISPAVLAEMCREYERRLDADDVDAVTAAADLLAELRLLIAQAVLR